MCAINLPKKKNTVILGFEKNGVEVNENVQFVKMKGPH